jgi:hypothetical protein
MRKSIMITMLLCACIAATQAQTGLDLTKYGFRIIPPISKEEEKQYEKDMALCLYYGRTVEYLVGKEKVEIWKCYHTCYKIYDKEVVEELNNYQLPTNKEDIISCGARLITSEGQITELGKKDIEQITDENKTVENVLQFPLAGVGDIVEFFSVVRSSSIPERGSYTTPTRNIHLIAMDFTIICPEFLNFDLIGYNGLPSKATDTVINNKRYIHLHADELPKINNDDMSFYSAHLPKIEYTLSYNYSNSRRRINTPDNFAANMNETLTLSKEDKSALKKIASTIKLDKKSDLIHRIQTIENGIKNKYAYVSMNASEFLKISFIQKSGFMNSIGALKLLYNLFRYYDIDVHLVFTTEKTDQVFDKKFVGSNFFRESLLYFPDVDLYTSPDYTNLRLGYPGSVVSGVEGLFCKPVSIKGITTLSTAYGYIPLIAYDKTGDSIDVRLSIDPVEHKISAQLRRSLTGYNAMSQLNFCQIKQEDWEKENMNDILERYLGLGTESINIDNIKVENINHEDIMAKPLVMKADLADFNNAKHSGDTLNLTIGVYIGKQTAIKQDEPRTLPIERRNNAHYYRKITVDIPQGYDCLNVKELETALYDTPTATDAQAAFTVRVRQEGNQIIILCEEYYKRAYYPVEESESIIKVVNAAADFNSAVLRFKKQN